MPQATLKILNLNLNKPLKSCPKIQNQNDYFEIGIMITVTANLPLRSTKKKIVKNKINKN